MAVVLSPLWVVGGVLAAIGEEPGEVRAGLIMLGLGALIMGAVVACVWHADREVARTRGDGLACK